MNTPSVCRFIFQILITAMLFAGLPALADDSADDSADAAAVVERFNAAVTARDMETVMDTLAEGSVQFQLRAVHPGMSDTPPLTADLRGTWKAVAGILFPISETYERSTRITLAHALGEIATVWADTTTRTARNDQQPVMELAFSEVYLLVKMPGGWKIAGIADNRKPDNIQVGGES
jgi:ketosteroid isomerase-like protein